MIMRNNSNIQLALLLVSFLITNNGVLVVTAEEPVAEPLGAAAEAAAAYITTDIKRRYLRSNMNDIFEEEREDEKYVHPDLSDVDIFTRMIDRIMIQKLKRRNEEKSE